MFSHNWMVNSTNPEKVKSQKKCTEIHIHSAVSLSAGADCVFSCWVIDYFVADRLMAVNITKQEEMLWTLCSRSEWSRHSFCWDSVMLWCGIFITVNASLSTNTNTSECRNILGQESTTSGKFCISGTWSLSDSSREQLGTRLSWTLGCSVTCTQALQWSQIHYKLYRSL